MTFPLVHNLAIDSKGNVFTTEVDTGKRAQKFLFRGDMVLRKRAALPEGGSDESLPPIPVRAPRVALPCLPRRGFKRGLAAWAPPLWRPSPPSREPSPRANTGLVIDCHGHYTTEPPAMLACANARSTPSTIRHNRHHPSDLKVSDDEVAGERPRRQLKLQGERGISLALFSPRAGAWPSYRQRPHEPRLVDRVERHDPSGRQPEPEELRGPSASCRRRRACRRRTARPNWSGVLKELGFVGCNVNPDPSVRLLD